MTNAPRSFRRLVVDGEIDLHRVLDVRRQVEAALAERPAVLALDLSQATFLDCTGLSTLLWSVRRAQRVGVRVVLQSPSPAVVRTLAITGSQGYFALAS